MLKLEEAIHQTTFKNEYLKAHLNILHTASWMNQMTSQLLKPYNLSWQQYNILRILRGRFPEAATVKELTTCMIDKMSNASRLVDKLKKKGLVKRIPCEEDRRRVQVTITEKGLKLLAETSEVMESQMVEAMKSISAQEATLLSEMLDRMRS